MPSAKEALQAAVERLSEQEAERLLDYLNLLLDPDTLSDDELTQVEATAAELKQGKYISLDDLEHEVGLPSSAA